MKDDRGGMTLMIVIVCRLYYFNDEERLSWKSSIKTIEILEFLSFSLVLSAFHCFLTVSLTVQ